MPYNTQRLRRRLTSQLAARGVDNAAGMATALLAKRGHLNTKAGADRQALGNSGRAKDRQAKYSGGKPSDYKYNSKTNQATKKR